MIENKKYPIDYKKGRVVCPNIERRIGDILADHAYKFACDFKFELYESDIQWIENNISKNSQNNTRAIFWKIDNSYIRTDGKRRSRFTLDYEATFFEQFIDTPGIPTNVNRLLIYTVGHLRGAYKDAICSVAPYQHFFIERWLEKTCR